LCSNLNIIVMDYKIPSKLFKLPCVIYYSSSDCGTCYYTTYALNQIKDNPEFSHITFLYNEYAKEFGIRFNPAFVLIDKDGKVTVHSGYENPHSLFLKFQTLI
jgi:thioredoxin-related protein